MCQHLQDLSMALKNDITSSGNSSSVGSNTIDDQDSLKINEDLLDEDDVDAIDSSVWLTQDAHSTSIYLTHYILHRNTYASLTLAYPHTLFTTLPTRVPHSFMHS